MHVLRLWNVVPVVPLALVIQSITIDYNIYGEIIYRLCASNIPSIYRAQLAICSTEIYNSRLKYYYNATIDYNETFYGLQRFFK
jgi:hypothetical protein